MSLCKIENLLIKTHSKKILLSGISCSIEKSDFVVILGSNGSGKTTMLKAISGIMTHYNGSIKIDGREVKHLSKAEIANTIGIITQNVRDSLFVEFSLTQNFEIYMDAFGTNDHKISDFLQILSSVKSKLCNLMDAKVMTLSGGEMQCFLLALNLFFRKKILLLDEHTSALDPKTAADVMRITNHHIQKQRISCIMTTHSLDDAVKYGNKLIAMQNGRIIKVFNSQEKENITKQILLDLCY